MLCELSDTCCLSHTKLVLLVEKGQQSIFEEQYYTKYKRMMIHTFSSITPFFRLSPPRLFRNTQVLYICTSTIHPPSRTFFLLLPSLILSFSSVPFPFSRIPSSTYQSVQQAPLTCQHRRQYSPSSPFRTLRCPQAQHIQTHWGGSCSSPILSLRRYERCFVGIEFGGRVVAVWGFERRFYVEALISVANCYFTGLYVVL
jgi:hypothetical protein